MKSRIALAATALLLLVVGSVGVGLVGVGSATASGPKTRGAAKVAMTPANGLVVAADTGAGRRVQARLEMRTPDSAWLRSPYQATTRLGRVKFRRVLVMGRGPVEFRVASTWRTPTGRVVRSVTPIVRYAASPIATSTPTTAPAPGPSASPTATVKPSASATSLPTAPASPIPLPTLSSTWKPPATFMLPPRNQG